MIRLGCGQRDVAGSVSQISCVCERFASDTDRRRLSNCSIDFHSPNTPVVTDDLRRPQYVRHSSTLCPGEPEVGTERYRNNQRHTQHTSGSDPPTVTGIVLQSTLGEVLRARARLTREVRETLSLACAQSGF